MSEKFVDISRVREFVINESLDTFKVFVYLAFIVEKEPVLVVPFKNCALRQTEVMSLYKVIKRFLFSNNL